MKYFIEDRIINLVEQFPNIKCSYVFDSFSSTHFIEVLPSSVYEMDEKYAQAEENFISSFYDLNVSESICFITDKSLVKMIDPSFVLAGQLYDQTEHCGSGFITIAHCKIAPTGLLVMPLGATLDYSDIGEHSYAMAA